MYCGVIQSCLIKFLIIQDILLIFLRTLLYQSFKRTRKRFSFTNTTAKELLLILTSIIFLINVENLYFFKTGPNSLCLGRYYATPWEYIFQYIHAIPTHIRFMSPQFLFNVARTIVCMHFCCTFQMCTGSKDIIISKIFPNVNKVSYRAKY